MHEQQRQLQADLDNLNSKKRTFRGHAPLSIETIVWFCGPRRWAVALFRSQ